jgi:hypothetical protein
MHNAIKMMFFMTNLIFNTYITIPIYRLPDKEWKAGMSPPKNIFIKEKPP